MHRLVDDQQTALKQGRQIMDAILIANECVDSRIRNKEPGILCELDIQKAFDHLNWNFPTKDYDENGFWGKMGQLDLLLHQHHQVPNPSQRLTHWIPLFSERTNARRPIVPFFVRHRHGEFK